MINTIKKLKNLFYGLLIIFPFSVANAVVTTIDNPLGKKVGTLPLLIDKILKDIVNPIGGIVIVFFIIYTGFLFVKAQGKPEEITKVKEMLLYVIIGAAIILGANLIALAIQGTVDALK